MGNDCGKGRPEGLGSPELSVTKKPLQMQRGDVEGCVVYKGFYSLKIHSTLSHGSDWGLKETMDKCVVWQVELECQPHHESWLPNGPAQYLGSLREGIWRRKCTSEE